MNNIDEKLKKIDLDLFLIQIINKFIIEEKKIHKIDENILWKEDEYIPEHLGPVEEEYRRIKRKISQLGFVQKLSTFFWSKSTAKSSTTTSTNTHMLTCKQIILDILKEMNIGDKLTRQNLLTLIVLIENKLSYESIILYMGYLFNNFHSKDMRESKESDPTTFNRDVVSTLILDKFYTNDYNFFLKILVYEFKNKLSQSKSDNDMIFDNFIDLFKNLEQMLRLFIDIPLLQGTEVIINPLEELFYDDINLNNTYKINKISTDFLLQHCDKFRYKTNFVDSHVKEGDYVIFKQDLTFNIPENKSLICKKGESARIVDYRDIISQNKKMYQLYYKDNTNIYHNLDITREQLYDDNLFHIKRINKDCDNASDEIFDMTNILKNNKRFSTFDKENITRVTKLISKKKNGGSQKTKSKKCHSNLYAPNFYRKNIRCVKQKLTSKKKNGGTQKTKSKNCHSHFYVPTFEIDRQFNQNKLRHGWNKTINTSNHQFLFDLYHNENMCRRSSSIDIIWNDHMNYYDIEDINDWRENRDAFNDEYLYRPNREVFIKHGNLVYNLSNSVNPEDADKLEKLWFLHDELYSKDIPFNPEFNRNDIYDQNDDFKDIYDEDGDWIKSFHKYTMILRSNFGFETLKCEDNFKIFDNQESISNEFKHTCIPILWFYKIFENYNKIHNKENEYYYLNSMFQTKSMEELLLILKRYILLENNFDEETLCFFIILGALQYITTNIRDNKINKDVQKSRNYLNYKFSIFDRYYKLNYLIIDEIKKNISDRSYVNILKMEVPFIFKDIIPYWINQKNYFESAIYEEVKQKWPRIILSILQLSANVLPKYSYLKPTEAVRVNANPDFTKKWGYPSQRVEISRTDRLVATLEKALKSPEIRLVQKLNPDGTYEIFPVDITDLPENVHYVIQTGKLLESPRDFSVKNFADLNNLPPQILKQLEQCQHENIRCAVVFFLHGAIKTLNGIASDPDTPIFFTNPKPGAYLLSPMYKNALDRLKNEYSYERVWQNYGKQEVTPDYIFEPESEKGAFKDHNIFGMHVVIKDMSKPKSPPQVVTVLSNNHFIELLKKHNSGGLLMKDLVEIKRALTRDVLKPTNIVPLVVSSCLGPDTQKFSDAIMKPLFDNMISRLKHNLPDLDFEQFNFKESNCNGGFVIPVPVGPNDCDTKQCVIGEKVTFTLDYSNISCMFVNVKFNHNAQNKGTAVIHLSTLLAFGHMMSTPNIKPNGLVLSPSDMTRALLNFEFLSRGRADYDGAILTCEQDTSTGAQLCRRTGRVSESFMLEQGLWNTQTHTPSVPFQMDKQLKNNIFSWIQSNKLFIKSLESNPSNSLNGGEPFFKYFTNLFNKEGGAGDVSDDDGEDDDNILDFIDLTNINILDSQSYLSIDKLILLELEIYFDNITKDDEMLQSELNNFEDNLEKIWSILLIKSTTDSYLSYFYKLKKQFDKIISIDNYQILFIIYVSRFIWETARDNIVIMFDKHIKKCELIENQIINMNIKNKEIKSLTSDNDYDDWSLYYNFNNMNKEEWEKYSIGLSHEDQENVIILTWFRYIALNNISLDNIDNDYELIISKIESIDRFNGDLILMNTQKDNDDNPDCKYINIQYGSKSLNYKIKDYDYLKTNNGKRYLENIKDNQNYYYGSLDIINEYMKQKYIELYTEFVNIKKLIILTLFIDIMLNLMENESKKFNNSELLKIKYIRRDKTFSSTIDIVEITEILTKIPKEYKDLFEELDSIIQGTKLGTILNNTEKIQNSVLQDNTYKKINKIIFYDIPEL